MATQRTVPSFVPSAPGRHRGGRHVGRPPAGLSDPLLEGAGPQRGAKSIRCDSGPREGTSWPQTCRCGCRAGCARGRDAGLLPPRGCPSGRASTMALQGGHDKLWDALTRHLRPGAHWLCGEPRPWPRQGLCPPGRFRSTLSLGPPQRHQPPSPPKGHQSQEEALVGTDFP